MKIVYHPGQENSNTDALSQRLLLPPPNVGIAEDKTQVSRLPVIKETLLSSPWSGLLFTAYLPTSDVAPTDVSDYREELMTSLTSARELAAQAIQKAPYMTKNSVECLQSSIFPMIL